MRIQSITFGEQWVEVTYFEGDYMDTESGVVDIQTRLIKPGLFRDEFASICEDIEDVLERAYVLRRNPPERFSNPNPPVTE